MTKKKKKEKQVSESYGIEIIDWNLDYSIHLSSVFQGLTLEPEFYRLTCHGQVLFPKKIAGREIEATFTGERAITKRLNENPTKLYDLNAIGAIRAWGETDNKIHVVIPHDVMPSIISAIAAKKINYITLEGETLYRGDALIYDFSFHKELTE